MKAPSQAETEAIIRRSKVSGILDQPVNPTVPRADTPEAVSATTPALTSGSHASDTSDTGQNQSEDDRLLAGVRDGEWLDTQEFPDLRYAVPDLIPEGFALFVGAPKVGKSWMVGGILLGVASGGHVLGAIPTGAKQRVLYLALEDGDRRMQDRCRLLLHDAPIPPLFHYHIEVPLGGVLNLIRAFLRRYPDTALVAIDTLGKVMPPSQPGESAYQRDYRIGTALKHLADAHPGLAVVVCHHDRKADAEDFVDSVSGTNGLAGSADTIVVLSRKRQAAEGLLRVTGRDVAEGEYALRILDGREWQLDGASLAEAAQKVRQREETTRLSATSTDVLEFVRGHPDGVAAGKVAERFGQKAYQYLKRQVKAGRLAKSSRGLYLVPPLSEVSEPSEGQVNDGAASDTATSEVSEAGPHLHLAEDPAEAVPARRPRRIQISRKPGWRLPEGTIRVDNGARKPMRKYGNRYDWKVHGRPRAVELYREHQLPELVGDAPGDLGGHDLACWCPLDESCHADALLEAANPPSKETTT